MAEEKKSDKKAAPKPAPTGLTSIEMILGVIFILAVVSAIVERIYSFLSTGELTFYGISLSQLKGFLPFIKVISFILSVIFAFGAITFSQLRGTIWIAEKKKLFPEGKPQLSGEEVEAKNPMQERWAEVLVHCESGHPSDWRLSIIEADVMLAELLDKMNLPGDTIGEKLKAVEKSDFLTLDSAWEAHKVRNQIAHEGSEFLLNDREARRVIGLYGEVFKEFFLI